MSGKRLKFSDRVKIQDKIENDSSITLIKLAKCLELSKSTIYNEILRNRISLGSKQYRYMKEKPLSCEFLRKFPFCCNICIKRATCAKEIFIYDCYDTEERELDRRHSINKGPRITTSELSILNSKVSPRIKMNQSIFHIVASDPEIKQCEQTIRRYINNGYFDAKNIDLPRTCQRKVSTNTFPRQRKRIDVKLLNNRLYADFIKFNNKDKVILEVDTVIGKRTDKQFILTILERKSNFQWGVILDRKSLSVKNYFEKLIKDLSKVNSIFFHAILTDNGEEMSLLPTIEQNVLTGEYYTRIFYCDPYSSYQKGKCERNHELFRYIKKKGVSLDTLTQYDINVMFSNINSYRRKSLDKKTPYEVFLKNFGINVIKILNIEYINPINVILK